MPTGGISAGDGKQGQRLDDLAMIFGLYFGR
jgi:hypothetical protein